ncbi:MAG: saccharopine dehydrogenase [Chitinophagaceae bacterium]|nr:MAG: saccharopine dehydrogenase [Chitinophagaceae bacterium]
MNERKKKIAVLGSGMVGSTIALDLSKHYDVTSFDLNRQTLKALREKNSTIKVVEANLQNYSTYSSLLNEFDLVASAVPGFMGYRTLETLISNGKNVVDISFFPEDALALNSLAVKNNVSAIVDCGVAPGMSNLILGYHNKKMRVGSFHCIVGGLPKTRVAPFEYKAPFSPVDVIEEYTRPARYMENGFVVTRDALSDLESVDLPPVGTLEAFNTDGLRSLLVTMKHIPNMKEKTLRYPGHVKLIDSFKKAGLFSERPVAVNGVEIIPIQLTSALLFDQWKLAPGENEFTIMKITVAGNDEEGNLTVEYMLYDENDVRTGFSSMSRTTGFTCAAAAHLVLKGTFTQHGVFPPELVGANEMCYLSIMEYLKERGVNYEITVSRS